MFHMWSSQVSRDQKYKSQRKTFKENWKNNSNQYLLTNNSTWSVEMLNLFHFIVHEIQQIYNH